MSRTRRPHATVSVLSIVTIGSMMIGCSDVSGPERAQKAVAIPSHLSAAASVGASGLVAAYGFNETSGTTTADASSLGNTGTLGSGVTRTTAGRFGGALKFNGGGMVKIPDAASLRLTTAMTLEAWVNPSVVNSAWRDVIYKGDDNYYLMATSSNSARPAGGASFGNTSATTEAYGTSPIAVNTWTHLAVTYDGATVRLYVNGAQVSSVARTGVFTTSANPLRIGGNEFYDQFFKGTIDEVRVYNRPLSAAEVQADMIAPVGTTVTPPADTAAPTVAISAPSASGTFTTSANQMSMSGTASDNAGVARIRWANSRGGSGVATGTTNWSTAAIPLQPGTNVVTVTAEDAANNTATTTLTAVSNVVNGATQVTITTQPSATAANGATFAQQPVIQLRDASGIAVAQSGVVVAASIASGGGVLGGTTTSTTDASGVATFTDLSITGTVGGRTLTFNAGSLTAATSGTIGITAGAVSKLIVSNIGSQTTNTAFNVTVSLADASNNPANNAGGTGTVRLTRQTGTGTLAGTVSGTIPVGSNAVTISGVTYSAAESGVVLLATGSGSTSTVNGKTGTSNGFSVADASGGGSNAYSTNFLLTENPISEGSRWLNGKTDGIDWSDVSTASGRAIGLQTSASYTDATALLKGTWAANQQVTATVFTSGAIDEGCYSEVELRLRSAVSPHTNRGYEVSFKVSQTGSAYLIIVRWNGPLGDYTYLLNQSGAQYGVKDGDVISAKVVGNVITAYKNGVVMGQASDGTYPSGSPGMGFNLENGQSGCSGTNDRYGFTHLSAIDGVTP